MTGRSRDTGRSTATAGRPDREHWSDVAAEWTAWALWLKARPLP